MLDLRLLDPTTDLALFHEAYNWRTRPKKHVQPDRMSFETFADANPNIRQIAIGLFNGDFQALYFLHETAPQVFQAHFTARSKVSRDWLLWGARLIIREFFANGAKEIHAWVTPRNRPLRSFLEMLGFKCVGSKQFPCTNDTHTSTLSDTRNQREFVRYVILGQPPSD